MRLLFLLLNITLLLLGGYGKYMWQIQLIGIVILNIELLLFRKRKLVLPPFFKLYFIFLIILIIHSYLFNIDVYNTAVVSTLFVSGCLTYLTAYNFPDKFKDNLKWLMLIPGIIFGIIFLYNLFNKSFVLLPWSLYQSYNRVFDHFHIGDLWAVILPYLIALKAKGEKIDSSIIIAGFILVFLSLSRSAYVSVFTALVFFILIEKHYKVNSKLLVTGGFIILLGFLYAGTKKETLFNRPYYVQAVVAAVRHPLGYGMGNFIAASSDPSNNLGIFTGLSRNAHNLFLEILAGMGIFSLPFFIWIYRTFKDIKNKINVNHLYLPSFIAIIVNFMFDPTYFVSTMFWYAFMLLGIIQSGEGEGKKVVGD
jgi:hypothetical protein